MTFRDFAELTGLVAIGCTIGTLLAMVLAKWMGWR
jgi:hypothetical protein